MLVKPDELANLCAIYKTLRTGCILESELKRRLYTSMLIDSEVTPSDIIAEGVKFGIIEITQRGIVISNLGNQLAYKQVEVAIQISESAKEFMVKKIFLNPDSGEICCGEFLDKFQADVHYGTLAYLRSPEDSFIELRWLKLLSRVGLIIVTPDKALVEAKYLDYVNKLLFFIREGVKEIVQESNIRNKVGDIAEECAKLYEQARLTKLGFPELAKLVQNINPINKSAGYDILSFSGERKKPEEQIYIEVKGTINLMPQFIWSRNERSVAQRNRNNYWIYCYDHVDITNNTAKGPMKIKDPIKNIKLQGFISEPIDIFYSKEK